MFQQKKAASRVADVSLTTLFHVQVILLLHVSNPSTYELLRNLDTGVPEDRVKN